MSWIASLRLWHTANVSSNSQCSAWLSDVGLTTIILLYRRGSWSTRKSSKLVQGHVSGERWSLNLEPGSLAPKFIFLIIRHQSTQVRTVKEVGFFFFFLPKSLKMKCLSSKLARHFRSALVWHFRLLIIPSQSALSLLPPLRILIITFPECVFQTWLLCEDRSEAECSAEYVWFVKQLYPPYF